MTDDNRPIDALRVARKVRGIRNLENLALVEQLSHGKSRFFEVIWALQFFSQPARPRPWHDGKFIGGYPGGLRAFARDLIDASRDLIGTAKMREFGTGSYDRKKASAVFQELPWCARAFGAPNESWKFSAVLLPAAEFEKCAPNYNEFAQFLPEENFRSRIERRKWLDRQRAVSGAIIAEVVAQATPEAFRDICIGAANESLVQYLRGVCERPHVHFGRDDDEPENGAPWFFSRIGEALVRFIDRRRESVMGQIADTEVSRQVLEALRMAQGARLGVLISGNSRFGKTESVQAFCEANPGRARLVSTPPANSESDLLRAVAHALGIETSSRERAYSMRANINDVIDQAQMMIVLDEAHAIFPSSFGRNTSPARLNWIRSNILDRGIPAAFICTPQAYDSARGKYLRTTNFAVQQWDARFLPPVHLPGEVLPEDLIAIAQSLLPTLHSDYIENFVSAVQLAGQNFVQDISRIAAIARFHAQEAGRSAPNFADIKAAQLAALPRVKSDAAEVDRVPLKASLERSIQPRRTRGISPAISSPQSSERRSSGAGNTSPRSAISKVSATHA
ncbi:MAG: ATP-binding protein [Chthoniobacterales bacterium]